MAKGRYLTAKQAAAKLDISPATLYAYVSRGLIRSEPAGGRTRQRRYYTEDVEQLKNKKEWRRDPEKATGHALQAGGPVLESAITFIADHALYYRGQNAVDLAKSHSIEQVAALLWTGNLDTEIPALFNPVPLPARLRPLFKNLTPMESFQILLPVAATKDLSAYDLQQEAVIQTGARILRLMTATVATRTTVGTGIARTLQQIWAPDLPAAEHLFNATLVLCADHELNASAFTARCVASTGATPYAAVSAGLAALQGFKHGGASERVETLFQEVQNQSNPRQVILNRLKRGELLPGFGHVLYRDVDPRAQLLLQLLEDTCPNAPALTLAREIIETAHHSLTVRFNLDFALATLAQVLNLPPGSAVALFALGRTAGWIGHAIEQYQIPHIIRPRARYTGEQPLDNQPI